MSPVQRYVHTLRQRLEYLRLKQSQNDIHPEIARFMRKEFVALKWVLELLDTLLMEVKGKQ